MSTIETAEVGTREVLEIVRRLPAGDPPEAWWSAFTAAEWPALFRLLGLAADLPRLGSSSALDRLDPGLWPELAEVAGDPAARGESQTAPRADLFRQLSVAEYRDTTSIPAIRRLDLTKNLSLWNAEHFHPGLLGRLQALVDRPVVPAGAVPATVYPAAELDAAVAELEAARTVTVDFLPPPSEEAKEPLSASARPAQNTTGPSKRAAPIIRRIRWATRIASSRACS